ncbi:hypothetical protein V5F34_02255 [Xanthobacter autotrophicus]|uniref:AtuA-related protein n=1 Tax=Xanthobacter autotrophicus TaxID=280 RepID=UPI003729FD9D
MVRLLRDIAYVRSGDKGDICSVGVMAKSPADYPSLLRTVTPEAIKALYGTHVKGPVQVYRLDNIEAVNVVMNHALGGGATRTLRLDQTGKALGSAILRLPIREGNEGACC